MSKHNKHDKKTNVINRTTSETLRLGESDIRVLPQSTSTSLSIQSLPQRKKIQTSSSSFQITAVSMTRVDFGDDSADDLDESHTDDISRVTDNETPSFSEDSRDTDDHQMYEGGPQPPACPNPPEATPKPPDEEAGARFKVVKVPSAAPFSRGRWTCFDFLDASEPKQPYTPGHQNFSFDNHQRAPSQSTHVQGQAFAPHFATVQQPSTKPAGTIKGFPQGCSSIQASEAMDFAESAQIPGQEIIPELKAANQPSNVNGQKDDILSDIKVALTSAPASHSGLNPKEAKRQKFANE